MSVEEFMKTNKDFLKAVGAFEDDKKNEAAFLAYKEKEPQMSKEESMRELFELWKQVPNWEQYPMPEVSYKYFNVKKPKPSDEPAPTSKDRFAGGPIRGAGIEMREPAPGGVRNIPLGEELPIKQIFVPDYECAPSLMENDIKDENDVGTQTDLSAGSLNRPRADSMIESRPS